MAQVRGIRMLNPKRKKTEKKGRGEATVLKYLHKVTDAWLTS